jgi:hypothetical protein
VTPIAAGVKQSRRLSPLAKRIRKYAWAIHGLMPKHPLSDKSICAAAAAIELAQRGFHKSLVDEFARRTMFKPGTKAYDRAEFRNVIYALYEWACSLNDGSRAPALLALYFFYCSAGAGPHPDPNLWEKLSSGMTIQERAQKEREFNSWRCHLLNRILLVRRALKSDPRLSPAQHKSILDADPLIADLLQERIPSQIRMAHGKAR